MENEKKAIQDFIINKEGEFRRLHIQKKAIDECMEDLKKEIRLKAERMNEIYYELYNIEANILINNGL